MDYPVFEEREFVLGTNAEGAPIIPISAQLKYNIEVICEYITRKIPVPLRDFTSKPRLIGKRKLIDRRKGYSSSFAFQLFVRLM